MHYLKTIAAAMILIVCAAALAPAQTFPNYTQQFLEANAPLPWQPHYDPAGRLTIGNDDGNASASAHSSAWASVIRYGGADGLRGLIDEFTVSAEGAPRAFGFARRGCVISSEATLNQCMLARWENRGDGNLYAVIVEAGTGNIIRELTVSDIHVGDVFAIERDGDTLINFYRGGDEPFKRLFLFSTASPFQFDGQNGSPREVRAAFEPATSSRKITNAQEVYYCCPWQQ
jgi:hypothetical protein